MTTFNAYLIKYSCTLQVTETVTLTHLNSHTVFGFSVWGDEDKNVKNSDGKRINWTDREAVLVLWYISRDIRQKADLCSNVSHM